MEKFFTLSYRDEYPLLLAEVGGTFRERDLPAMVREICDACRHGRYQAVLVDATRQSAPVYPPTEYVLVRYRIATTLTKHWRASVPLAIVVSEERYIPDYLIQTVCSFHGLRVGAFTDIQAARAWLGPFVSLFSPSHPLPIQPRG